MANNKFVGIWVPDDLGKYLQHLSKDNHVNISSLLRSILVRELSQTVNEWKKTNSLEVKQVSG